jgi:hypothetical protein
MDINNILEWVKQNPMGTEFMLLEIIKNLGVKAEINGGLIFIQVNNLQDENYVSVLVTNRSGDDIVSHKDIKINPKAKLNLVALKYEGLIAYSLLSPNEQPDILSIPELEVLEDGDYIIYSDGVLVSKIFEEKDLTLSDETDKIDSVVKKTRKRVTKET